MKKKTDRHLVALLWIFLGIISRVIPHPSNITPMNSLCLFGGTHLPRWKAFAFTLVTLLGSDILLGKIMGYPAVGAWSIFSYTGFAAIVFAGTYLRKNANAGRTAGFLVSSSLGYWVWTNFGTWLTEGLYPHTASGFGACFVAGLPFLRNALLGDLLWGAAFFLSFSFVRKKAGSLGYVISGA